MNYEQYVNQVRNDAIEYIDDQVNSGYWTKDTSIDDIYDELFVADGVTGNGSGSYTFNRYRAAENVADAIWDDDIVSALDELVVNVGEFIDSCDPEGLDVSIRCAILSHVMGDLEEHFDELFDDDDDEEDEDEEENE